MAAHRLLFRQHRKDELVALTGRFAAAGLVFLLLAMLGSVLLIVDFVAGPVPAGLISGVLAGLSGWLWYVLPTRWRRPIGSAEQDKDSG